MTVTARTFACRINNSAWMHSLESAYLSITTPKGTNMRIDKWSRARDQYRWDADGAPQAIVDLVHRVASSSEDTLQLTKEEIMLWHLYSDLQGKPPYRPKQKSYAQRKFESAKRQQASSTSLRAGICPCGGHVRTKDHGSWTGWKCTRCGEGGSFNNKNSKF